MSVEQFLNEHFDDVEHIVYNFNGQFNGQFSSHQFIQKFARQFERNYIDFLHEYRKPVGTTGAFQEVHKQIGKFLLTTVQKICSDWRERRTRVNMVN